MTGVICDRCGKNTIITTMSMFNTDMCCQGCISKEKLHPKYTHAKQIENEAVIRGEFNFPGIGLPVDYYV